MRRLFSLVAVALTLGGAMWGAAPGRALPPVEQTSLNVSNATPSKATTETDCTFQIVRSGQLSRTSRVEYDTDSGTAKEDRHFTKAVGSLEFAADETTKTVTVDVLKQKRRTSSFTLRIFNPSENTTIDDEEGFCRIKHR